MGKFLRVLALTLSLCVLVSACNSDDDKSIANDGDSDPDFDSDLPADSDSDIEAEAAEDSEEESSPSYNWPKCERIQSEKTLAEKAAYFDKVSREQHLSGDKLYRNILLSEDLSEIQRYEHTENTILWSGMYLSSQAFRYAVTKDPEALENARTVVDGLLDLTRITGVKGLYGRCLSKPGLPYPEIAADNPGWTDSPAEGYEGWRYRNDVSKDGYDGLMFGYAAALEHFDDEQLVSDIKERLREIIDYIVGNGLQIYDANGVVTEHGRLYHSALDDYPGFNAMLSSSWVKIAQMALEDKDLDDFYYGCLMEMREGIECPDIEFIDLGTTYIGSMEEALFLFIAGGQQNYDNFDMCYQAIYPLLRREKNEELRERLLWVVRNNMFHTTDARFQSVAEIGNAFYTFSYAGLTGDSPEEDPVLANAVDLAVCILKEFPEIKYDRFIPKGTQEIVGYNRMDRPIAEEPIPLAEYHFDNYLWRLDFFEMQLEDRPENRRLIFSSEDYLMAYWMGRYHRLITEDM